MLDSYFNLTNRSNLTDRLQYDLIRFFDRRWTLCSHEAHNRDVDDADDDQRHRIAERRGLLFWATLYTALCVAIIRMTDAISYRTLRYTTPENLGKAIKTEVSW